MYVCMYMYMYIHGVLKAQQRRYGLKLWSASNSLISQFQTPKTIRTSRDCYYGPTEVRENINSLIAFPFISAKLILDVSLIKWQTETNKSLFLWSEPSVLKPEPRDLQLPVGLLEGQFRLHLTPSILTFIWRGSIFHFCILYSILRASRHMCQ